MLQSVMIIIIVTRLAGKRKGKDAKPEASSVPFKQASPMKKAPAAQGGTFYGTIGGKIPYEPVRLISFSLRNLAQAYHDNVFSLRCLVSGASPVLS